MPEFHSMEEMCRAGCTSRRGVRLWQEKGLLGEVARSAGDTRQFTAEQIDRARIIAAAQFGGFDLETIKGMIEEYHTSTEVFDALTTRLADQMRAAGRLAESLPTPLACRPQTQEFDL